MAALNKNPFQALSDTKAFVLGTNGNLWLEHGPFGTVPPSRQQVDGNVRAFQALSDTEVLVLGMDGNLWLEQAPFGNVPPSRQQVDGNVAGFQALALLAFVWVLGTNGNLWLEQAPFGTVPPQRQQIDGNVRAFQALDLQRVLVLGTNGNLWLEQAPFGNVPPSRQQVDGNVRGFQALSDTEVLILGTNGNLWLEHGPFKTVPPQREQVDGNVGFSDVTKSGDLTITPTSITFNHNVDLDGLDVGSITGPISATITSNGSYNFTGNLNNSGWLPYNFSVLVVLKSKSGTTFTFGVTNSIGGDTPWSSNSSQWDNNGNNSTIKDVWGDLQAECSYSYKAAAGVDWQTLWNEVKTAIGYIKDAVELVG